MSPRDCSTEIKRLRQALEESDARRQALLHSALDCVICADDRARITEFNGAAERAFRLSRSAALGKDLVATIFPPVLRSRHRQELFVSQTAKGVDLLGNRLETRCQRADGTMFPAEITVTTTRVKKTSFTVNVRDITARKHAEEAVLWLAAIVESSQDAIIGKDMDGNITSWNKGAEVMYGYTPAEVIGRSISLLMPARRKDDLAKILAELRAGRRLSTFETIRVTKRGKLIYVALSVSPVRDSDGTVIGASVIARDITQKKATERALQKANEASIYASPIPVIAADLQGRVLMWSPAAERVFGWTEAEVLGKPNPIIPESDAEATARMRQHVAAGGVLTGIELRRLKRDGSAITVSLSAAPLWNANRAVRGIIGFLNDITDRKMAEEMLRAAEEKYRSIFEGAIDGIYQTTLEGHYISANPALARMLGFASPEELVAARQDIRNQEYVDPELREKYVSLMQEHGAVQNFEYQVYRKDGSVIWVSENAHVVRNEAGNLLYFEGTVQDITGQRELENQMRQMQRIEAVGRLAGGVAHDFNNILMAISSYAELLSNRMDAADGNRRYVSEIDKAMNRGASLTQSLLAFSRKQVLSPKVVNLNVLVAQEIDMLKRLIPENIELKFAPTPGLGQVKVDPIQLEQVVMNLVINARDAMPDGGVIRIEIEDGAALEQLPGQFIVLTVTDNGCGMNADTKAHIFEPFFTTKEQGKGTGLGLATVFGIVKQSGGHITVESEPGRGSIFRVYLPKTEDAVEEARRVQAISARGNETILLVEDEHAVRESTAEFLAQNGYRVLIAENGPEALRMAEQYEQPIHLLLSDLVMPRMSGKELSERIVGLHAETRVVFMSGYSQNLLSHQQILDPAYSLLHKPFRLADLGQLIRETLDRTRAAKAGG